TDLAADRMDGNPDAEGFLPSGRPGAGAKDQPAGFPSSGNRSLLPVAGARSGVSAAEFAGRAAFAGWAGFARAAFQHDGISGQADLKAVGPLDDHDAGPFAGFPERFRVNQI